MFIMFRWWTTETIAVVTGANRGIGFEITHQLAMHGLTVVLTSRETAVGEEAVKVLQEGGLNVVFHQLDIIDPVSIERFSGWLKEEYGGLDILVCFPFGVTIRIGVTLRLVLNILKFCFFYESIFLSLCVVHYLGAALFLSLFLDFL